MFHFCTKGINSQNLCFWEPCHVTLAKKAFVTCIMHGTILSCLIAGVANVNAKCKSEFMLNIMKKYDYNQMK